LARKYFLDSFPSNPSYDQYGSWSRVKRQLKDLC